MKTIFFYWKLGKKRTVYDTLRTQKLVIDAIMHCQTENSAMLLASDSIKISSFPVWCPFFTPLLSTEFTWSTWEITFLGDVTSWQCWAISPAVVRSISFLWLLHHCSLLGTAGPSMDRGRGQPLWLSITPWMRLTAFQVLSRKYEWAGLWTSLGKPYNNSPVCVCIDPAPVICVPTYFFFFYVAATEFGWPSCSSRNQSPSLLWGRHFYDAVVCRAIAALPVQSLLSNCRESSAKPAESCIAHTTQGIRKSDCCSLRPSRKGFSL